MNLCLTLKISNINSTTLERGQVRKMKLSVMNPGPKNQDKKAVSNQAKLCKT